MKFSELLHVTNQVRQGGVFSSYFFSVYLDDLSLEVTNITGECYIGEIVLNHLVFADDICVFWTSVRGLQGVLDVCQAYAELHWIILNCSKTICMTLRLRTQKARSSRCWHCGVRRVNLFPTTNIWGLYCILRFQRQLQYQKLLFSDVRTQWKNVLLCFCCTPSRPCTHLNYGMILESHACRDCVWLIILDAELYTTCPGEQGLVVIRFNVNIPTFEAFLPTLLRKNV